VTYGDELALGLVSIDGLVAGADSLADGAAVGSGARVGVGVEDGPHPAAAMARPMMTMTRLSTVIPPSGAFDGSTSIVAAPALPARCMPVQHRSMRLAGTTAAVSGPRQVVARETSRNSIA
jgi:hypothetical protein